MKASTQLLIISSSGVQFGQPVIEAARVWFSSKKAPIALVNKRRIVR
jgi:hypothetical protein